MKAVLATMTSIMVLALTGCASMQVQTDYDPGASFGQLSTYDWVDGTGEAEGGPAIRSQLLERRIQNAIDNELARRGYQKVTSSTPDFLVTYHVATEEKHDVSTVERDYDYGGYRGYGGYSYPTYGHHGYGYRGYGHRGYGHGGYYGYGGLGVATTIYRHDYLQGTLVLDIIDTRTNELIWRGWANTVLDHDPEPEKVQMYVDEAVRKILEEFPPQLLVVDPRTLTSQTQTGVEEPRSP